MRLSDVLGKAPDTAEMQVEAFLGPQRIGWGQHRNIQVGRVVRTLYCIPCRDTRTFLSGDKLSCLVTGVSTISVDVTLRCSACRSSTEAWYLVGGDDLFSQSPIVHLERYTENRRNAATGVRLGDDAIDDLLERAQIAYGADLGAGAMVYLRKIFEIVTSQAAKAVGIDTKAPSGRRKTFKALLEEVDGQSHIVPSEFSSNKYRLFSELSTVIHGNADEAEALRNYAAFRRLVLGIINNINNNQEMARAVASLGWDSTVALATLERDAS